MFWLNYQFIFSAMIEENPLSPIQGTPHPTPNPVRPHLQSSGAPENDTEMAGEEMGMVYGTAINAG